MKTNAKLARLDVAVLRAADAWLVRHLASCSACERHKMCTRWARKDCGGSFCTEEEDALRRASARRWLALHPVERTKESP